MFKDLPNYDPPVQSVPAWSGPGPVLNPSDQHSIAKLFSTNNTSFLR
ncbi:hypothetical protein BVRB_001080 [Beta vulgaris subsp. vulgaris]|uniref:Uncharacterized protein n=1 Tax=Beta vulgaris subsp. vulgaris TaxID=3555 RepID=A0A0J8B8A7_BETVV|nr:hypothetical protein BVRB_001080 [Beta vulgaris subsp. vulgaris]